MKYLQLDLEGLGKISAVDAATENNIKGQLEKWQNSDYAGFRKILNPGTAEAPLLERIREVAQKHKTGVRGQKMERLVVLGTGGSSLGTEAIWRALSTSKTSPRIEICDNNDPDYFADQLAGWNPETTLFYVVSKSGTTLETISQWMVAREWLKALGNASAWKSHVVFCTDSKKGDMRKLVEVEGLSCLEVPHSVGGRFSVLTAVGLFPAEFVGFDTQKILNGARECAQELEAKPLAQNECFLLAKSLVENPQQNIAVLMSYSSRLSAFGRWFSQLWAESLGKESKGFTPYPAIGTTDQHSQVQLYMEGPKDKKIGLLRIKNVDRALPLNDWPSDKGLANFEMLRHRSMKDLFDAEYKATFESFKNAKIPVFEIALESLNEESLGALFYFWELCTCYAGALMGINPFDQPGVEMAKVLTKKYLSQL